MLLWLTLSDARILGVPLACFPELARATPEALARFELTPRGIHWEALDEDLSFDGLLTTEPLEAGRSRGVKRP
uniref:DUF2442 domain-containing protein n=1 Tax=Pantoea sp. IMH TaxID=1267600 RepID=UPI00046AAF48|nr:DUF2442 domain-containing protein [Pantoea sp. IMH]